MWDDAAQVYLERLQTLGLNKTYEFEHRNGDSIITIQELDELFSDFRAEKEQLARTEERLHKMLKSYGQDPQEVYERRLKELRDKGKEI